MIGATFFNAETLLNLGLFVMLITTAVMVNFRTTLFSVVMLSGVFSLLSALLFVTLDAVDVAFTEAAVGAGITTVLMLGTIALTKREVKHARSQQRALPLLICFVTGAALIYGTLDMPNFGDPNSPANAYLAQEYLTRAPGDVDVPNVVTAILASYRGFDTMGEVAVVFAAGIGVLMLLSQMRRRKKFEDKL